MINGPIVRAAQSRRSVMTLVAGIVLGALAGTAGAQFSASYTTYANFDQGNLNGVNHDAPNSDQLQLNAICTTFPLLWVANAGEDTVSRIDTDPPGPAEGCEVARYQTWFANSPSHLGNPFVGPAPSRTAVDGDGNVYVANRHFSGRRASVLKILVEGGIDRNGNNVIDTSIDSNNNCVIDPDEIIPLVDLNNNGILEDNELADERVAWVEQVGAVHGLGRALCIDPSGFVWLGLFNFGRYFKLDPANGDILGGPFSVSPIFPYGCRIDGDGILWSADRGGANPGQKLGKFDTNTNTFLGSFTHGTGVHYSIGLGNDRIYLAIENANAFLEFNPTTNTFTAIGSTSSRGISVDGNGDIVLGRPTIEKRAPDGTLIWSRANPVGNQDQRGVIIDSNNDVWVVNKNANNVSKFRGIDGVVLGVFPVGSQPYTYSDATGFSFRNVTNPSGIWEAVADNGSGDGIWDRVAWNTEPEGSEPAGSSITVEARAADTLAELPFQAYSAVSNGVSGLGLAGRFLGLRATLRPDPNDVSPVLSDITAFATLSLLCDADANGVVDITDIRAIGRERNTPASPGDVRDVNGDDVINANDARMCVLRCTNSRCVP